MESRLGLEVKPRLLLESSWTGDTVTQTIACACGGVAVGEEGEDAGGDGRLVDGDGRVGVVSWREVVRGQERCGEALLELVQLKGRVPQAVVVGDVVEELLRVESSSKEEREVAIRRFDDVRDLVHCVAAVECVGVDEPVLEALVDDDASLERLGDAREEGGVDDGRSQRHERRRRDRGLANRARARHGRVGPQVRSLRRARERHGAILRRHFGLRREHPH